VNAKFDETFSPEQVMEVHCLGFLRAHDRRVASVHQKVDKQWGDTERTRTMRYPTPSNALEHVPRLKDRRLLEKVAQQREGEKIATRSIVGTKAKWPRGMDRGSPLPLEDCAFERGPTKIYYAG
jgi:hypothetical protein